MVLILRAFCVSHWKNIFLLGKRKKARELEIKENWIYSICIYKSTIFFIYLFSLIFHTRNTMNKNLIVYRKTKSLSQSLIKYYHWSIAYFNGQHYKDIDVYVRINGIIQCLIFIKFFDSFDEYKETKKNISLGHGLLLLCFWPLRLMWCPTP